MEESMDDSKTKGVGSGGQNYLRQLIFIVCYRKKLITGIFGVVFLLATALAVFLPPAYRSSAKFSVSMPQQLDPLQRENSYDYKNKVIRFLQDQKEIVLSNKVLTMAVQKLNPGIGPQATFEAVVELRKNMDVTPPSGETFEASSVYHISYTGSDPKEVARVTEAISEAYVTGYREISKVRTDYSYEFFKQQTQTLHDEMQAKEKALTRYETENAAVLIDILNLEPGKTNLEVGPYALLTEVTRKSHQLQEELAGMRTSMALLEKEVKGDKIPLVLSDMEVHGKTITAFKNRVAQLQIQLNEMKPQFSDQYEPVKQLKEELDLNVRSMREELGRTLQAQRISAQTLEAKVEELERLIGQLQERIRATAEERARYEQLKQEYTLARDAYVNSRNQLEQARLANALNQENQFITLVEKPEAALQPFKPNRPLLVVLGFIAGTFLALGTALTVDFFDHTIKTPEDIETYLGARVEWTVPRIGHSA
jgi:polysaccharide biosynthesis transport protein